MVTCKIVYFMMVIYWRPSIFNFVLCSAYLVDYALNPNSMIEIAPELWPLGHCSSPMLAFLCKNLNYKPQSINLIVGRSLWCFIIPQGCLQLHQDMLSTSVKFTYMYLPLIVICWYYYKRNEHASVVTMIYNRSFPCNNWRYRSYVYLLLVVTLIEFVASIYPIKLIAIPEAIIVWRKM